MAEKGTIMFYAIIFIAATASAAFEAKMIEGPYPTIEACATDVVLSLGRPEVGLIDGHPGWDFRAVCREGDNRLVQIPGEELMDMRALLTLAGTRTR
jgi:hypothetical protein